jgi:uncharacterized protein (DUF1499 family)
VKYSKVLFFRNFLTRPGVHFAGKYDLALTARRTHTDLMKRDVKIMLRAVRLLSFSALLLMSAFAVTAYMSSKEEFMLAAFYEAIFGPPDLGPIDFESFNRSQNPNTAMACPPDFCRRAPADFDPGVFPVSDDALRDAFTRMALSEPQVIPVYRHAQAGLPIQDRYVQRTKLMQFPDTIDVRFIALTDSSSTLAIYSRSQIGRSDFGVNLKRIKDWTSRAKLELK